MRREQSRAITGPVAAFIFFGAWMSCIHFMYYDVVLAALPVFLLLTEPHRYLQPVLVAVKFLPTDSVKGDLARYFRPGLEKIVPSSIAWLPAGYRNLCVLNSLTLSLIVLLAVSDLLLPLIGIKVSVSASALKHAPLPMPIEYSTTCDGTPWPTFCILALWAWCAWLWLRASHEPAPADLVLTPGSEPLRGVARTGAAQLV